jgi:hypothetical protein
MPPPLPEHPWLTPRSKYLNAEVLGLDLVNIQPEK